MTFLKLNLVVIDQSVISLSNFLLSILFARIMSTEQYGQYIFAFTTLILGIGLLNNALSEPMNVIGAALDEVEWKQLLLNSTLLFVIISMIFTIILWIISIFLPTEHNEGIHSVTWMLSLLTIFYLGHEYVRRILLTRMQVIKLLLVDILTYGSRILIIFILIIYGSLSVRSVLLIFGVTCSAGILIGIRVLGKSPFGAPPYRFKKNISLQIWNYGKWTLADWFPFFISGQLYVYFVAFMLGSEANGAIGACNNLLGPLQFFAIALTNISLPHYSTIFKERGYKYMIHSVLLLFRYATPFVLIYLLLVGIYAGDLMISLFPMYEKYSYLVGFLCVGMLFQFLFKPVDIILRVIQRPKVIFFSRLLTSGISLIVTYPLILNFNLSGAVFSYVISQIVMSLFLYTTVYRYHSTWV